MKERELQRVVVDAARLFGWRVYHTYDSRRSEPGFPDLVMVKDGRLMFVELKSQSGRVRPEQKGWLGALAAVPGVVVLLVRPDGLDGLLGRLRGDGDE